MNDMGETDDTDATAADSPDYLQPYLDAARRHGGGFGSLLWASPVTQAARFDAFTRATDFAGRSMLDVGCGRADFLDFLLQRGIRPDHYAGIEAVTELADVAEWKYRSPGVDGVKVAIIRADFVAEPARLFVAADIVAFSGSLNTMPSRTFYATLRRAFEACAEELIFNFLDAPFLASGGLLHWRRPADVLAFARGLTPNVREWTGYLQGDRTLIMKK